MKSLIQKLNVINLDRRSDRLEDFLSAASKAGVPRDLIVRFPAVEEDFGALGCAKSHASLIFNFLINEKSELCAVFEDDFDFLESWEYFQNLVGKICVNLDFDVLMLTGSRIVKTSGRKGSPVARLLECKTTAGYIVRRHYAPTLLEASCSAVYQLQKYSGNPSYIQKRAAIDIVWQQLQRRDRWYICDPLIGRQRPGLSDIENRMVDYSSIQK